VCLTGIGIWDTILHRLGRFKEGSTITWFTIQKILEDHGIAELTLVAKCLLRFFFFMNIGLNSFNMVATVFVHFVVSYMCV
jgi:hypothetical protein